MTDPKNIIPFTNLEIQCPKCGNNILKQRYNETMDLLILACSCGYDWYMRPRDYKDKNGT